MSSIRRTLSFEMLLNGLNPLFYRGYTEQSSPLPLKTVFIVYEASMYIVDDNFGSYRRCKGLDGCLLRYLFLPASCADILF